MARLKLAELRASSNEPIPPSPQSTIALNELIPRLSPTIKGSVTRPPLHLAPLVDQLELAISERAHGQQLFWFSVPPRHYKSETLKHAIVKHLLRWPEQSVAYCTHTGSFACTQSRSIRRIAISAGLQLSPDSNRQDEWELATGGGLCARGLGGELTGRGFRLIVIDDPVKSREQAESAIERAKIWDWINDDVLTRLSPDGFVFCVHTRWHPDDPIGRAKLDSNWTGINLPSLSGDADDVALLPDVWSVDFLRNIRDTNPYKFASLYQGEPRPRGGKVFGEPTWYDPREIPTKGYQIGHGCDLAYAAKTYSDQSVLITGIRHNGLIYVVDAIARRCQAHEFAALIKSRQELLPGPCRWYCSTTERGTAGLMRTHGANIIDRLATADKFVRAQPAANAWNLGKILLPSSYTDEDSGDIVPVPEWVHELLEEVGNFTGVSDRHDDFVDSLAAMYDQLNGEPEPYDSRINPATCVQEYNSPMSYG